MYTLYKVIFSHLSTYNLIPVFKKSLICVRPLGIKENAKGYVQIDLSLGIEITGNFFTFVNLCFLKFL